MEFLLLRDSGHAIAYAEKAKEGIVLVDIGGGGRGSCGNGLELTDGLFSLPAYSEARLQRR